MPNLLTTLKQQIDALEQRVNFSDFPEYQECYFDEQLFNNNKVIADRSFYLEKIKQTYTALTQCVLSQRLTQMTFLSESLVNQIEALTRELATHQLRQKQPETCIEETLSEKHARHLDYLRRLQEMKYELELSTDSLDYKKIATIDNRIYRCEQAIQKIELEMESDV